MKNLIITLTLLLGVMSYGQDIAVVTEYTNSAGEMIFVHKNGGSTPPGRCQFGDLPRFALTGQYSVIILAGNRIGIDPDVRNGNTPDGVTYNIVSNADREAFRNDVLEDRQSPATAPNIYRTRNGGLSFDTPCGNSGISNDEWLRSQPNFSGFFVDQWYQFGGVAGVFIRIRHGEFVVDFPTTGYEEVFDTPIAAYERIQELIVLRPFERELVRLGFIDEMHHEYEWNQRCSGSTTSWNWRVDVQGDRINLRDGKLGFTSTGLSIEEAMRRIRARLDFCQ